MRDGELEKMLPDSIINMAWGNANFGDTPKREVIKWALLKFACGYKTGYTIKAILLDLGLLTQRLHLTTKGKKYLFECFDNEHAKHAANP